MKNATPYIKNIKNKQNKLTIQQLRKINNPPDIYQLTDKERRQFTDIMLQINEEPKDVETKQATGNTGTRTEYTFPTCPYVGKKAHRTNKHRQRKRNAYHSGNTNKTNYENSQNRNANKYTTPERTQQTPAAQMPIQQTTSCPPAVS